MLSYVNCLSGSSKNVSRYLYMHPVRTSVYNILLLCQCAEGRKEMSKKARKKKKEEDVMQDIIRKTFGGSRSDRNKWLTSLYRIR